MVCIWHELMMTAILIRIALDRLQNGNWDFGRRIVKLPLCNAQYETIYCENIFKRSEKKKKILNLKSKEKLATLFFNFLMILFIGTE